MRWIVKRSPAYNAPSWAHESTPWTQHQRLRSSLYIRCILLIAASRKQRLYD